MSNYYKTYFFLLLFNWDFNIVQAYELDTYIIQVLFLLYIQHNNWMTNSILHNKDCYKLSTNLGQSFKESSNAFRYSSSAIGKKTLAGRQTAYLYLFFNCPKSVNQMIPRGSNCLFYLVVCNCYTGILVINIMITNYIDSDQCNTSYTYM